jgi:hypothetical protein
MQVEDMTGKTIKILVDTFGNDAGDYVEIEESDAKAIFYTDKKERRCRFLRTQAGMLFRYEEPSEEEVTATLQEAAETPSEPEDPSDEKEEAEEKAEGAEKVERPEEAEESAGEVEEEPKKAKKIKK